MTIAECWVSRGIWGAPTKIDFRPFSPLSEAFVITASPIIYRSCSYICLIPVSFAGLPRYNLQAQRRSVNGSAWEGWTSPVSWWKWCHSRGNRLESTSASIFIWMCAYNSLCNKKDWSNEIVHLICHDVQTSRMVKGSTCRCSVGYTWSQVVSFNWIMAMIGCPSFTIWEHGKKSKICLGIIFTAPRDKYAPHGSMWKWK